LLDLLPAMFKGVVVPWQVVVELDMGRFFRPDTLDPRKLDWLSLTEVSRYEMENLPPNRLGIGERAVIAYALSLDSGFVCLDDLLARRLASSLGLKVIGIAGFESKWEMIRLQL